MTQKFEKIVENARNLKAFAAHEIGMFQDFMAFVGLQNVPIFHYTVLFFGPANLGSQLCWHIEVLMVSVCVQWNQRLLCTSPPLLTNHIPHTF